MPTTQQNDEIDDILKSLVRNFAGEYDNNDGGTYWWGHDTDLGDRKQEFAEAREAIQRLMVEARVDERKRVDYELEVLIDILDSEKDFVDEFLQGLKVARKEIVENTNQITVELQASLNTNKDGAK